MKVNRDFEVIFLALEERQSLEEHRALVGGDSRLQAMLRVQETLCMSISTLHVGQLKESFQDYYVFQCRNL